MLTQHILSAFNLDQLPDADRKEIMDKLTEVAEGRILLRIVTGLNDEQKKTFESIMDAQDQAKLQAFFEAHVPDILTIIEEETKALQQELLARMGRG